MRGSLVSFIIFMLSLQTLQAPLFEADGDTDDVIWLPEGLARGGPTDVRCVVPQGSRLCGRRAEHYFSLPSWGVASEMLHLQVRGRSRGSIVVQVYHENPQGFARLVQAVELRPPAASDQLEALIPMPAGLPDRGFLFYRIHALASDLQLLQCSWCCQPDDSVGSVRLAIVVTHFQREASVYSLARQLLNSDLLADIQQGQVALYVIDQSASLDPALLPPYCRRVVNPNFGGAGGFSRGLLEAQQAGFSHCLFMDDDVAVTPEAILRTLAFQRLHPEQAVAGCLLQAERPWLVLELGGRFAGFCHPIGEGTDTTDLSEFHALLISEYQHQQPNYAAWCYFAFPIHQAEHRPFPFFVRGDDILFGLMNRFSLRRLPGVVAQVPGFQRKEGPLQALLDTRMHLMIRAAIERMSRRSMVLAYAKPYLNFLLTYRYGHCLAMHEAVRYYRDCLTSFTGDLDASWARAFAADMATRFWQPAGLDAYANAAAHVRCEREPRWLASTRKGMLALTLNLHLVPGAGLFKRRVFESPLSNRISYKDCLSARAIYFRDEGCATRLEDQSRLCHFNQGAGLRCLLALACDCLLLTLQHGRLSHQANLAVQRFTRPQFWERLYGHPQPPADPMSEACA